MENRVRGQIEVIYIEWPGVTNATQTRYCCSCGVGLSCSSKSTPSLGNPTCYRCGYKEKKKSLLERDVNEDLSK